VAWSLIDRKDFLRTLSSTLSGSPPSAEALLAVQDALEEALRPGAVEDGIAALRGVAIQRYWLHTYGGTVVPPVRGSSSRLNLPEWVGRPWFTNRFMSTLEAVDRRLQAARVPWPDKLAAIEALQQAQAADSASAPVDDVRRRTNRSWWLDPIADVGAPSSVRRAAARLAADRAAMAALAIERFRRANADRLPAELSELTPGFMKSVPEDPFSGNPLLYRKDSTGYVVYSVGENRSDDHGSVDPEESDVGLRVSARKR
jgi:hypothetical protein